MGGAGWSGTRTSSYSSDACASFLKNSCVLRSVLGFQDSLVRDWDGAGGLERRTGRGEACESILLELVGDTRVSAEVDKEEGAVGGTAIELRGVGSPWLNEIGSRRCG